MGAARREAGHRFLATLALAGIVAIGSGAASAEEEASYVRAAAAEYARIIRAQESRGLLDRDEALLARISGVAGRLRSAAVADHPEAASWAWEYHVTQDPEAGAFCLAGGKVLVGGPFVRRLSLVDAELAMLLAHEMAHAIAGHRARRAPSPDASTAYDPAGELLQVHTRMAQEDEADRLGLRLALRAGFSASELVSFFDKLAASEPAGTFSSSHLPSAVRAQRARESANAEAGN